MLELKIIFCLTRKTEKFPSNFNWLRLSVFAEPGAASARLDAEAGAIETPIRSNNFLSWFRQSSTSSSSSEVSGCRHNDHSATIRESGSRMNRNRNWFRRAATIVAGPGHVRHHQQTPSTTTTTTIPSTPTWTTTQSSQLHQIRSSSASQVNPNQPIEIAVITQQPESSPWKPESPPLSNHPIRTSAAGFTFQHTESFNNDSENEETISENLNSAINSLLDFQTADLEVASHAGQRSAATIQSQTSNLNGLASSNGIGLSGSARRSDDVIDESDCYSWNSRPSSATIVSDVRRNGRQSWSEIVKWKWKLKMKMKIRK